MYLNFPLTDITVCVKNMLFVQSFHFPYQCIKFYRNICSLWYRKALWARVYTIYKLVGENKSQFKKIGSWNCIFASNGALKVVLHSMAHLRSRPTIMTKIVVKVNVMLPAHFHDAAGDLLTIVEKFWDCPKFWLCSCYIVFCSLNSSYIRVLFGVFRSLLVYFVLVS